MTQTGPLPRLIQIGIVRLYICGRILPSVQRSGGVLALSLRRAGAFIFSR